MQLQAGILTKIVTGGMWTMTRREKAGYKVNNLCPLCGLHPDTEFDLIWKCTKIREAGIKEVENTEDLSTEVATCLEKGIQQSVWFRGMIPVELYDIAPPSDDVKLEGYGEFEMFNASQPINAEEYVFYLDESGGEFTADVHKRRAGWGVAIYHRQSIIYCEMLAGFAGSVAGILQTNNRACLTAFIFILKHTTGDVEVVPDAKYLSDGCCRKRYNRPDGINADLWYQVGVLINERNGHVKVRKTDAHVKQDVVLKGQHNIYDYMGNKMADVLANKGAELNRISSSEELRIDFLRGRTNKALKRAVEAYAFLINETSSHVCSFEKGHMEQVDHHTRFQRLIHKSGHVFCGQLKYLKDVPRNGLTCIKCHAHAAVNNVVQWLEQSKCNDEMYFDWSGIGAEWVKDDSSKWHPSHQVLHKRGIWWCASCGAFMCKGSRTVARLLKDPCKKKCAECGKSVINRLQQGKTPTTRHNWPLEEDELIIDFETHGASNDEKAVGLNAAVKFSMGMNSNSSMQIESEQSNEASASVQDMHQTIFDEEEFDMDPMGFSENANEEHPFVFDVEEFTNDYTDVNVEQM